MVCPQYADVAYSSRSCDEPTVPQVSHPLRQGPTEALIGQEGPKPCPGSEWEWMTCHAYQQAAVPCVVALWPCCLSYGVPLDGSGEEPRASSVRSVR